MTKPRISLEFSFEWDKNSAQLAAQKDNVDELKRQYERLAQDAKKADDVYEQYYAKRSQVQESRESNQWFDRRS